MRSIQLSVRGHHPMSYGVDKANKPKEWEWRKAIADEASACGQEIDHSQITAGTKFSVEIVFYFKGKAQSIPQADLDNLAKPVLDTLFKSANPQVPEPSLTGALFDVDDKVVWSLLLQKRAVDPEADEGADIVVWWTG